MKNLPRTKQPASRRNLYYLRRARGWSQQHLAGLVGVSHVYVHLVESGKEKPSPRFALACSTLLDAPTDVLFGPVDSGSPL